MRDGARLAAAIEILTDLETRKRPAADAVKEWMGGHRFAGSKDRSEIGDIVFGALRWKSSSAWRLGDESPRAAVFGAMRWGFGKSADELAAMLVDDPHAPAPLSAVELAHLREATLDNAPAHVRGDYPEWLDDSFARVFGEGRDAEGAALAAPAPLDLRANVLKSTREALLADLDENPRLSGAPPPTPYAPQGVRLPWRKGGAFPFATTQAFQKGWFEVQDEGSQLAALWSGAAPGMQVADVCAGGGGKTLALAALMQNKGQIYAYDVDDRRLAPLHERCERAGARNVQIRTPLRNRDALADLEARMDVVLVDAPCTGSGTWRRNPDSKWRLRPNALAQRQKEQGEALELGARLVKPGGVLVYVTCSVLPEENEDAVTAFRVNAPEFTPEVIAPAQEVPHYALGDAVQLTPNKTGCDGFFVALLRRTS
jgi:16S rRNA (cytosine967-C5)-methyltransferase